jgi:two-component system phosphate regulon response regulator PhoB
MQIKPSILLVEDEPDIANLVRMHLDRVGYAVQVYETAEEALLVLAKSKPDLAIVDWMLPSMSGLELCRKIAGTIPVVMLTARADARDVLRGLEAGADDYVTKPFDVPILLARVGAVLRRSRAGRESEAVTTRTIGVTTLDLASFRCERDGADVPLTNMEARLFAALAEGAGRVLTRDRLIASVQGVGVAVTERTIDQHVYQLRKKLGPDAVFIESIRGVGYRVNVRER